MARSLMRRICVYVMLMAVSIAAISISYGQEEAEEEAGGMTFLGLIKSGGFIMVPILLGSVAMVALSIEHALTLQFKKVVPEEFKKGIKEVIKEKQIDMAKVKSLSGKRTVPLLTQILLRVGRKGKGIEETESDIGASPVSRIVLAALEKVGHGRKVVEETISDIGSREVLSMQRKISWLSIIAVVAPMLGLLGTVTGMIRAFQQIVVSGTGKPSLLAQGVSEALITTAAGLIVAIPAMLAHFMFKHRVQGITVAIESFSTDFVDDLYSSKGEDNK